MTIVAPVDGDDLDPLWGLDITEAVNTLLAITTAPMVPWNPTLTNLTVGNGTLLAEYKTLGPLVFGRFKFQLGTTSTVGTSPTFTVPVTAKSNYILDDLMAYGQALNQFIGSSLIEFLWNSTTVVRLNVSATTPFTFGNGDSLLGSFLYVAA